MADEVTTPRIFLALHVYSPPSCDVTSLITKSPRDCMIRLSEGRLEFSFSHVTWGTGFPLTPHCSDAIPVLFTTMDIGGDTIKGAEMDSPGSPLGPWGPWSPLGPGGPWSPWVPLGPCGPWGPAGPCLPGDQVCLVFPWLPSGNAPRRPGYLSLAELLFWYTHDWRFHWRLISCLHFWRCVFDESFFLQLRENSARYCYDRSVKLPSVLLF